MTEEDQYPRTIEDMSPQELGTSEVDEALGHSDLKETWADKYFTNDPADKPKYRMIASMLAGGMSQIAIGEAIGLKANMVCLIANNSVIKNMVKELQDKHGGREIEKRFKLAAAGAMDRIDDIIQQPGDYKEQTVLSASTWLLEKTTGKATQTVDHKGNVLSGMLDRLDEMRREKKTLDSEIIEANPISPKDQELDSWVGANIPTSVSVGDKSVKD